MFTLNDVLQNETIRLQSDSPVRTDLVFRAAQHDSRQIKPGDLYVALKGARVDGHQFIASAAQAGALGALCTEPAADVPANFLQISVADVLDALQVTARARTRRQQSTTLIGITGSNGKTSTKEAVAAVLSGKESTLKCQNSYNNKIGYPLTLLRLEPEHRYAVLEMAATHVGDLTWLCERIARPTWSLITSIGTSHLESFGSQEQIAVAKSELVQALTSESIALLNYDDILIRRMAAKTQARILYYGCEEGAEVRARDIKGDALLGYRFTLDYHGERKQIQLRLPGTHGITIALAAAAAGCAAEIPLDEICAALETLRPVKGRGEIKGGPNGSTLIDDTFNANRQSILAMTKAMHETTYVAGGKRWVVLGDVFEMGVFAQTEHHAIGEALAGTIDSLVAIGDQAQFYVEGAIAAGLPEKNTYYFGADPEHTAELEAAKCAVADLLKQKVQRNDLVLLKGSRGMQMETLLELL